VRRLRCFHRDRLGARARCAAASGAGEAIGTLLVAQTAKMQARKQWMADHLQLRGAVTVDAGAVAKLRDEGKSLLPIGMMAVEGISRGRRDRRARRPAPRWPVAGQLCQRRGAPAVPQASRSSSAAGLWPSPKWCTATTWCCSAEPCAAGAPACAWLAVPCGLRAEGAIRPAPGGRRPLAGPARSWPRGAVRCPRVGRRAVVVGCLRHRWPHAAAR
jgi:hypothetical protein